MKRALTAVVLLGSVSLPAMAGPLDPGKLPRLGAVSERFQSYNVEMIEVTGGAFWRPYEAAPVKPKMLTPAGRDPLNYADRAPKDLSNPRLVKLAAALAPAYVRVSGTWANTTYFADSDTPPSAPPQGYAGVLTRAQWKGVLDFAKAVDAKIISSFPISTGSHDASGAWTPGASKTWLAYTKAQGGEIAAAEFANEPSLVELMGLPKTYDAAQWGRDYKLWHAFVKEASPNTLILGPGSVGDKAGGKSSPGFMTASDMLSASGPGVDGFSYHYYGDVSQRCQGHQTLDKALSENWLAGTEGAARTYAALRDRFEPGKPLWLTEVGDAACGGNPWAKTFADSFRYLDQLGRLAKLGVQVVAHNTLAISDYGLIDEKTYTPRPNYWAALAWRRFMGTTVLDSGMATSEGRHVYAQCTRGKPGAVTLLVINNSHTAPLSLDLKGAGLRYTLSADKIDSAQVKLNGKVLALGKNDTLPEFVGAPVKSGAATFAPETISFIVLPNANNPAC
ncbi:hypothetical protein FHS83_003769 [Rhizomicrobium palustre]|uniref:Beta-glucuronidase C-terminal domain-containing protein n=1 Tax=Rhizomicrobium palustre TaxID=189966 RepID=A0A846N5J3_9PROT|nr:hypothetical protein [Rhizomicrobium palustre]NIK90451.1 hypothetical protein [Rhizomicrobium palustre]